MSVRRHAGRIESTGPRPSARLLILRAALGIALAVPGVGWYFWKQHRAPAATAGPPGIADLPSDT